MFTRFDFDLEMSDIYKMLMSLTPSVENTNIDKINVVKTSNIEWEMQKVCNCNMIVLNWCIFNLYLLTVAWYSKKNRSIENSNDLVKVIKELYFKT